MVVVKTYILKYFSPTHLVIWQPWHKFAGNQKIDFQIFKVFGFLSLSWILIVPLFPKTPCLLILLYKTLFGTLTQFLKYVMLKGELGFSKYWANFLIGHNFCFCGVLILIHKSNLWYWQLLDLSNPQALCGVPVLLAFWFWWLVITVAVSRRECMRNGLGGLQLFRRFRRPANLRLSTQCSVLKFFVRTSSWTIDRDADAKCGLSLLKRGRHSRIGTF